MEDFTWINTYNKIAHKILEFKGKTQELAKLMYICLEEANIEVPKEANINVSEKKGANLDKDINGRCRYTEIDPISFMNRFDMYSDEKSKKLIEAFEKNTGMEKDIPGDFNGIPKTSTRKSSIIMFKEERGENDISDIWNLFEIAVNGNLNEPKDKERFKKCYDKVISKKNAKYNVSIGLFKVRPDIFLSLDRYSRKYLEGVYNFEFKNCPKGKDYLKIIDEVKEKIKDREKNFVTLSYKSWKYEKYYWVCADPKELDFSKIEDNQTITYTAINDKGNKRRIYNNYKNARKNDIVIAYATTPIKAIVAICVVEENLNEKNELVFKKVETLSHPIQYKDIVNDPQLAKMEFLKQYKGSLFALEKYEYDKIIEKIRELNPKNTDNTDDIDKKSKNKNVGHNTIYYGIPGSGKSYYIKNELLKNLEIKEYERITFYPEYTYSDFVGTYKISKEQKNSIKPCAGPFTRILLKAITNPNNNYALIIEELNRGNAEAIFGDIFQLLDREEGESEYSINNDFIEECTGIKEIKIPSNLCLIATINTSDQNVFNLDTAFGRRWDYIRIDDDFSIKKDTDSYYSTSYISGFENIKWNDFRISVNNEILNPENNIWNKEDKQLGLYYISKKQLSKKENEQKSKEEKEEERKKFVYKVIRYLWFDVFKNEEKNLIKVLNNSGLTQNELKESNSFDELAKQIISYQDED